MAATLAWAREFSGTSLRLARLDSRRRWLHLCPKTQKERNIKTALNDASGKGYRTGELSKPLEQHFGLPGRFDFRVGHSPGKPSTGGPELGSRKFFTRNFAGWVASTWPS